MSSIKLVTIRGIPIRMHITFPLILIWVAFQYGRSHANWLAGAAYGIAITLLLFVCVILHELAHSLVALSFGTEVSEIVLLPVGGAAKMEQMPERPYQELLMAAAGPAASAGVGLVLGASMAAAYGSQWLGVFLQALRASATGIDLQWQQVLPFLVYANLFLAAFNLIPAFPMDGGRVLRALLALVLPYGKATSVAVFIGQGLAWLIGLFGILQSSASTVIVALFVYVMGTLEGRMVRVRQALTGLRVRQAFSRKAQPVSPADPLERAVDLTLGGFQADFPVCDGERLVGLLTRNDVLAALKDHGQAVPIAEVMKQDYPLAHPDDDLFEARQRMDNAGLDTLPVVEGESFLGLLTRQDLEEVFRVASIRPEILRPEG